MKCTLKIGLVLFAIGFLSTPIQAQDIYEIGFSYQDIIYRGLLRTNPSQNWTLRVKGYAAGNHSLVVFIEEKIRITPQTDGLKMEGSGVRYLPGNRLTGYEADNIFMTSYSDGTKRFYLIDNAGRASLIDCVLIGPAYINNKLKEYGW